MSDLIKALEADLFGAYEWAADLYEDLVEVREAHDRVFILQGLFRSHERIERGVGLRMEGVADVVEGAKNPREGAMDAEAAADLMAAAEDEVADDVRVRLGVVAAAREALLDCDDTEEQVRVHAPAYLAAFDAEWANAPRDPLAADAVLAALVRMNLLAGFMRKDPSVPAEAARPLYRDAADLYAAAASMFEKRVREGGLLWQETARSAFHRARSAWRSAGDEERARVADEAARGLG